MANTSEATAGVQSRRDLPCRGTSTSSNALVCPSRTAYSTGRTRSSGSCDLPFRARAGPARILERNYTAEYPDPFVAMEPELSAHACELVPEVLTMFRVLQHAWGQLHPDEV